MRGIIAAGMLLAVSLHAQNTGLFSVRGEIQAEQNQDLGQLAVEVVEQGRHQMITKALVARDGTFELRDVSTGTYDIRIVTQAGVVLRTDYTVLAPYTATLTLKLPSSGHPQPPSGSISVAELKHHVNKKARHELQLALKAKEQRDRAAEMEHLDHAIEIDPDYAEAYQERAVEYLAEKDPEKALPELQQIARIHPGLAEVHSNLAIILLQLNRAGEAENEAKAALRLNPELPKAQYLLAVSLVRQRRISVDEFRRSAIAKQWNLLK